MDQWLTSQWWQRRVTLRVRFALDVFLPPCHTFNVRRCSRHPVNRTIYVLCILLAVSQAAHALSYSTAEGTFAHQVTMFADVYSNEHNGRSPASWSDLQPYLDQPIDEVFYYILPTKRYAFLQRPLRLPPPHEGELVIVTRRPFRESRLYTSWYAGISRGLREPGRYIIYRTSAGSFKARYVEEAYIQQAFRGSESLLPSPDTEPERRHESEARWRSFVSWAAIAAIPFFLLARFIYRRFATRSANDRNA